MAQKEDYYYQIPDAPAEYSANAILARLIDGIGFRYYWATYGLHKDDLYFKPGSETRTIIETIQHIDGLTEVALNTFLGIPTKNGIQKETLSFADVRSKTLSQLQEASIFLRTHDLNPEQQKMIFQNDKGSTEFPLWNLINGPISDALWHIGQVVSFRRSAGNPFPSGVSVLQGTKRD